MKNKLLKRLILPSFLLLGSLIYAQSVTGIVSDVSGPLPGVNVLVKGTTTGTQTDFDGNYTLNNVSSDDVLVFSFLGYKTQEIPVNDQTVINILMEEGASRLQEVIVVGYVSQTRGDLSGAVATVDVSEAIRTPVVNAAELLQGRASGVTVINSGTPGDAPKINIRGFGTPNNTDPLYIIDGVQTDDAGIFNSINPGDIDQLNVLKDAAAAIYGARAANGVVIVTTKSGGYNMAKAKVSVDFYTGSSEIDDFPDLLNPAQHRDMIFQSLVNDGAAITHPQYDPSGTGTFTIPSTLNLPIATSVTVPQGGTKWLEQITQSAQTQNLSISLQNGNETGKYFMSASYLNRDGILIGTGFKRGVTRLNSEFKLPNKITIGEHLSASFSRQSGSAGAGVQVNRALRSSPILPVFDDDGAFAGPRSNSTGLSNTNNPVASLTRAQNDYRKRLRVFGDIYLAADLYDGLSFKTTISGSIESFNSIGFTALDPEAAEPIAVNLLRDGDINTYSWTWTNTLNYKKSFGDHKINALVGIEALEESSKGKGISRTDFLFETPDFYLLNNGAGAPQVDFAFDGNSTLFSIFGTTNYSYKSKYLATATVRYDKSSRFKGDNKSDVFASFSAGWIISKEDFFPQDATVSRLKLTASYGEIGNQSIFEGKPTDNQSTLSESLANYSFDGNSITSGAILSQIGNQDLKWETSTSTNIGVDLGLFDNALSIGIEYFNIETKDLLAQDNSLVPTTGPDVGNPPFVNIGTIENEGFDFNIRYNNRTKSGLTYSINANISTYDNEVTDLVRPFISGSGVFRGGAITRTQIGRSISEFYGRVVEGVFASEAEVAAAPDQNFASAAAGVGRFQYKDINGDGVINDEGDRTFIGSPHPDFTYGVNLNASYKGFDIVAFFQGSEGNDIYNYERIFTDFPTFFNTNQSTRVLNAFSSTNPNSNVPALSQSITNSETAPNSFFVEDGSYLRLKNLQIGYTLPSKLTDKMNMESLRVYVQGTNLFTITDYEGFDPELRGFGDSGRQNLNVGVDFQTFPVSQVFSLGLNLKF